MFRSIFGFDWKKSPAHLLFLSKFREPRNIEDISYQDYWQDVLNESQLKAVDRFINDGMLIEGDVYSCMKYKFKNVELKQFLKERGLKQSGRKAELINRLVENDPEDMKKKVSGLKIYECSSTGHELVEDFLQSEREKRAAAERNTISFLSERKFNKASKEVASYEAEQVFSRGIGIDWLNHDTSTDEKILSNIFNRVPKILDGLEKDKLESLRIVAGMMWLWGKNEGDKWIGDDFETGFKFDTNTSAKMLWYHAKYLLDIEEYKQTPFIKTIGITGANDDYVCDECKKIQAKKFNLNQVPELPYVNCTSETGCRCHAEANFDF